MTPGKDTETDEVGELKLRSDSKARLLTKLSLRQVLRKGLSWPWRCLPQAHVSFWSLPITHPFFPTSPQLRDPTSPYVFTLEGSGGRTPSTAKGLPGTG